MRHPWQIWTAYVTALIIAAVAVGAVTYRALAADRAEQDARAQGALEENVRLALWRMDSLMVPFVSQESSRSSAEYRPLLLEPPPPRKSPQPQNSLLAASPLLTAAPAEVAAYFDYDTETSTLHCVPGPARPGFTKQFKTPQFASVTNQLKAELAKLVQSRPLAGELPLPPPAQPSPVVALNTSKIQSYDVNTRDNESADAQQVQMAPNQAPPPQSRQQSVRGAYEFRARSNYAAQGAYNQAANTFRNGMATEVADSTRIGSMRPIVVSGQLILARQAIIHDVTHIQGCWLDWNSIQRTLRESVADLVPDAKLTLVSGNTDTEPGRLMASLPVRLELNGTAPVAASLFPSTGLSRPLQFSLALAWTCLILIAIAAFGVLRGVLALSERRASFVSAVTHELRTPLTTFKMYAEMLAENMVPDETSRQTYLQTLRGEADRLSHLVENVLAYARLERGGLGNRIRSVSTGDLLELIVPRASERARQAGFEISVEMNDELLVAHLLADPSAVEQIFFNLIDNAAKYAAIATDRRVHLRGELTERHILLKVNDHGPGLPADQKRRLFEPFHKSATDAAASAPGVGLGLALSRRLARDMGGDLIADSNATIGAAFVIKLRRAEND